MFSKKAKKWLAMLLTGVIVITLVFTNAHQALAARSGGRIGGGSFRAPTPTYSAPRGGYSSPAPRGGIGFPFILPFFGFGGAFGGIFGLVILLTLINFLVGSLRNLANNNDQNVGNQVSVAQLQVGLLASARDLQPELDQIAENANTDSGEGRAQVIQEVSLALLRHPEYWVYGATTSEGRTFETAEARFNQLSLAQRSKFTEETLANFDNQLRTSATATLSPEKLDETGEYIIVTILVGAIGKLSLPDINGEADLRQALQAIGGLSGDRLLAIEVLWTPQAPGDILTRDDLMAQYPNLKLV